MNVEYTIILPHDDVCELIAGRVPHDVPGGADLVHQGVA